MSNPIQPLWDTVAATPQKTAAWGALIRAFRDIGQPTRVVACWQEVCAHFPDPAWQVELAGLLTELHCRDEALHVWEHVGPLHPTHEVLTQWGVLCASVGQSAKANGVFAEAARRYPDSATAWHNLGVAQLQLGQSAHGIQTLQHALNLRPDYPEALYSLATALAANGQRKEAIPHLQQALALRPNYPEALNNLGLQLNDAGRFDEAIPYLRQACRLRATLLEAWTNLGIALEAVGRFDEAEDAFRHVLQADPNAANAHTNMANLDKARGRLTEALASYQIALWLHPDAPSTRYNRSLTLLQAGQWTEGFREYEWRLRRDVGPPRCPTTRPLWDGSPANGRTIIVWAEQGLGDTLQFVRYAPLLQAQGWRVWLHVPGILLDLCRTLQGIEGVLYEGETLPPHDVQCPLMSLPHHCGTTPTNVPASVPYLAANPALVERWKAALGTTTKRTIGLYWQGNPHHRGDRWRSVPLRFLEPIIALPNVRIVSLQQGPGREQVPVRDSKLLTLGNDYQTVDDLAAVIVNVDLVVSVDTAAAHLAGALGKPVWLLVAAAPDWRWLMDRSETPWYPTARLFRQQRLGDWGEVIASVSRRLTE